MATRYSSMTADDEWFAPSDIIEIVRSVYLGRIDLDPASSSLANESVQARRFFGVMDNGLVHPWFGPNIFVNPPYKRETIFKWATRAITAVSCRGQNVIWLSNANVETEAIQLVLKWSTFVCFPSSRLCFTNPKRKDTRKAMQASMICLLTPRNKSRNSQIDFKRAELECRFECAFSKIGRVLHGKVE